MSQIETTDIRLSSLQKAIVGTTIIAAIGAGILGEDILIADNEIRGRYFTDSEYQQYRIVLINKIRDRAINFPTHDEFEDWLVFMIRECSNLKWENITLANLIEKMNAKLEQGCT